MPKSIEAEYKSYEFVSHVDLAAILQVALLRKTRKKKKKTTDARVDVSFCRDHSGFYFSISIP